MTEAGSPSATVRQAARLQHERAVTGSEAEDVRWRCYTLFLLLWRGALACLYRLWTKATTPTAAAAIVSEGNGHDGDDDNR